MLCFVFEGSKIALRCTLIGIVFFLAVTWRWPNYMGALLPTLGFSRVFFVFSSGGLVDLSPFESMCKFYFALMNSLEMLLFRLVFCCTI